jgi:hypothetical protein
MANGTVTEAEAPETVDVTDLDQFVRILVTWHNEKVKVLSHMLSIPPGSEATLDEGTSIKLSGDSLKGFQLGVQLALIELGTLPFSFEPEDGLVN